MKKPAVKKPTATKGKDPFAATRKVVKFPATLAWSRLRDDEIATQLGCSANTVFRYRKAKGKPHGPRKAGSGAKTRIELSKINMKLTAMENADKHGCSYGWMLGLMAKKRALKAEEKAGGATAPQPAAKAPAKKPAASLW